MLRIILHAVALAILLPSVVPKTPSGVYCGSYQDIVKDLRVSVVNISAPAKTMTGYIDCSARIAIAGGAGVPVGCRGAHAEAVSYTPSSGTIALTNVDKPTDCLGKILSGNNAPTLDITYDNKTDTVTIDADGQATIPLTKSSSCK